MKHNIHPSLLPLAMPIEDCHQDPANARTGHDIERIAASLAQYGQRKPIVVNRSENYKIEAGNGTWAAARSLDWTHIAAAVVEDDAMTAVGYALADNRLAELSRWDYEALQTLVSSLDPNLELVTGFAEGELEAMLQEAGFEFGAPDLGESRDAEPQLDRAEELAAAWGVQPGQVWRLPSRVEGQEHRIICGDCTDPAVVQRLMAGERAALFATDPPYLVDYDGTNHPQKWNESPKKLKEKNKDWSASYKDWDAAELWQWAERAEAWDVGQRLERLREEDEARRKNRERRIALLNGVMARASDALLKLDADEAKWSDVVASIRLAVQELRHEYGDDVTTVKVETTEMLPEWVTAVTRMETEQLDRIISNLSLVASDE